MSENGDGNGGHSPDPATESPDIAAVYDRIASHFSETREYPWPEVSEFLDARAGSFGPGSVGLDVGCGNGRHTGLLAAVVTTAIGLDVSRALLYEGRDRSLESGFGAEFIEGEATALPLDTSSVDLGVYVATIHHLRSRSERVASLDELARVLDPDGVALVSAWSTAHDRFDASEGFDTTVDWTLPGGETLPRFYHIYDPAEFEADIEASDLELEDCRLSSGNCYAVVRAP